MATNELYGPHHGDGTCASVLISVVSMPYGIGKKQLISSFLGKPFIIPMDANSSQTKSLESVDLPCHFILSSVDIININLSSLAMN